MIGGKGVCCMLRGVFLSAPLRELPDIQQISPERASTGVLTIANTMLPCS